MKVTFAILVICLSAPTAEAVIKFEEPKNFDYSELDKNHLMIEKVHSNSVTLTDDDKTALLKATNALRGSIPKVYVMLKMRWDDTLARMAGNWAARCEKGEPNGKLTNLPMYDTSVNNVLVESGDNMDKVVDKMAEDDWMKKKMLPSLTTHMGCGAATCKGAKRVVCVYAPRHLAEGTKSLPYVEAATEEVARMHRAQVCTTLQKYKAGKCDGTMIECNTDDIHSDICYYGNDLTTNVCMCKCQEGEKSAGSKCEKIACVDWPSQHEIECAKSTCSMDHEKEKGAYLGVWAKCQKTCNDKYKQDKCGL